MSKFVFCYSFNGAIEIEADSIEEAEGKFAETSTSELTANLDFTLPEIYYEGEVE